METSSIKIFISGDFYGGGYGGSRVEKKFEAGEFGSVFGDFKKIIGSSDLAVTNLESPVITYGKPLMKTGPVMKSSPATINALSFAGFDLVTLANNHILDYGVEGLQNTIQLLEKSNIAHVGASPDIEQVRKPYFKEINSKNIGFLNFSENEWSTANRREPGANPLNPVSNFYDIDDAKKKTDYLVVILHGGNEHYHLPNPRTKETCRFYIDAGADLVVCHHAHCYSGFEDYKGKRIYYGLGNFLFDRPKKITYSKNTGLAVQVEINDEGVSYKEIPYKQCQNLPQLELLDSGEDVETFNKHMFELNSIIQDDERLESSFNSFIASKYKNYSSFLEPYSGKLRALYKRNLLPSALTNEKKRVLLNLIRCESHRDVIVKILSDKIDSRTHP